MKIVHVISHIDPKNGGPQAVVMRIAAAQSALGHDVHIVSYGDGEARDQAFEAGRAIPDFSRIHWHVLPEPGITEKLFCFDGRKLLRKVLPSAAFVHLHGVWEPILPCAAAVARSAGVPYCLCPAGMLDKWSMQQRPLKKRLALALGYKRMLDEAKFIHALNVDEADLMAPLALKAPKVIIPNGVFPQEFDPLPDAGAFRDKIALRDGRRYILFLSRLHFKKGLDILARAFHLIADKYPDVDLVVAGPAAGAEDEFMSLIRQFALEDRVHLTGPIYGQAKLDAFVDAACFCLPSRQEGFSIAITEALACETPVVITDACHFPEVATAEAGVVVPLDPSAVAKGLAAVLRDHSMAQQMGKNGRRLVMEHFTWPAIAELAIRNYDVAV